MLLFGFVSLNAQTPAGGRDSLLEILDKQSTPWMAMSRTIWEKPEISFKETSSAGLIREALRAEGFTIKDRIAEIPTAFVAEWGQGAPRVGIIGEYDALPGLSQIDSAQRKAVVEGGPGHGCGHNLFGTASALAAVSVKRCMQANKLAGTI